MTLLDGLQVIGTTPVGRVQLHVLAALAEFERARIAERVAAGLARARTHVQRIGRPQKVVSETVLAPVARAVGPRGGPAAGCVAVDRLPVVVSATP